MKANLFERWALHLHGHGRLEFRQLRQLLRLMRAHRVAVHSGDLWPTPPKALTRRLETTALWALFRLSVEEPTVFTMGLIAMPVAIAMLAWGLVTRVLSWI